MADCAVANDLPVGTGVLQLNHILRVLFPLPFFFDSCQKFVISISRSSLHYSEMGRVVDDADTWFEGDERRSSSSASEFDWD
ncbi:uncharacterized protein PHALS_08472 [Plasmopara halstedii]|uniref:Uncharacterized protein n=1 Tax=Plasmopara halstedii TaxID=4781 RepID=A0A0P1ADH3_PLAHL|nr:uncharacterized protein PHALS_08472 [Plasmopara halstedii]CEG38394.1 hypothetical protein PHALS_08472 [Plasmopara halstedii]|eukprot:XP_024574763.1 hypothetical protein PHALS_08472 [Plasmopara halstedii]